MKPLHSFMPTLVKTFLFTFFFLATIYSTQAQVYYVHLSGPSEQPPNNSAGTGTALIIISGTTMRVQANFSGLTGTTTASHIHAPTAGASTGTAGVATTTPSFTGFPAGVQSGSYDHLFDMTLTSSFNASYITANGGTPASAFAALTSAMAAGRSYLNIHTNVFPGGEIRGFLLPCPTIVVNIPDAFALSDGAAPNTVYPPYSPATSLTLQANVTGGAEPYSYNWSTGATSSGIIVSPATGTTYTLTVTDQNGCAGTASASVAVVNVAGGNKGQQIVVCHNGSDLAIAASAVQGHLGHGDMLASCASGGRFVNGKKLPIGQADANDLTIRALSQPAINQFELYINSSVNADIQFKVYDVKGRLVESSASNRPNQIIRFGSGYHPGVYLVQVTQGIQMQTLRLVKSR